MWLYDSRLVLEVVIFAILHSFISNRLFRRLALMIQTVLAYSHYIDVPGA